MAYTLVTMYYIVIGPDLGTLWAIRRKNSSHSNANIEIININKVLSSRRQGF